MASESEVAELKKRIVELEGLLSKQNNVQVRKKIGEMSSEVVDSNPYR